MNYEILEALGQIAREKNVDKELEALSRHLPGLKVREPSAARPASTSAVSHPLSDVIIAYCAERKAGGAWTSKTLEANVRTFDELVERRA